MPRPPPPPSHRATHVVKTTGKINSRVRCACCVACALCSAARARASSPCASEPGTSTARPCGVYGGQARRTGFRRDGPRPLTPQPRPLPDAPCSPRPGTAAGATPPYVNRSIVQHGAAGLIGRYPGLDVVYLLGQNDTCNEGLEPGCESHGLETTCMDMSVCRSTARARRSLALSSRVSPHVCTPPLRGLRTCGDTKQTHPAWPRLTLAWGRGGVARPSTVQAGRALPPLSRAALPALPYCPLRARRAHHHGRPQQRPRPRAHVPVAPGPRRHLCAPAPARTRARARGHL